MLATLIIPFSMIIMILTDNKIYTSLQQTQWGKSIISVLVTLYCAMAYIWASGEINRIFSEAPSNFPWAISILTVVHFFKNIVLAVTGTYLFFLLIYANFWIYCLFTFFKDIRDFFNKVISGVTLILSLSLIAGTAGLMTQNSDALAKVIAVKADFNQHHNCTGEKFKTISGVVFLSHGYVLTAHQPAEGDWIFEKTECVSQIQIK
jgi:hypothetical protein